MCFWNAFHLILMHVFYIIQCFKEFLRKNAVFFKKFIFLEFWPIEPVFRSIEIAIKIFGQPLFVLIDARLILDQSKHFRSIEPNFWSIKNCIKSFFKNLILTWSTYFSKSFQTHSLSIRSVKAQIKFFVIFLQFFC